MKPAGQAAALVSACPQLPARAVPPARPRSKSPLASRLICDAAPSLWLLCPPQVAFPRIAAAAVASIAAVASTGLTWSAGTTLSWLQCGTTATVAFATNSATATRTVYLDSISLAMTADVLQPPAGQPAGTVLVSGAVFPPSFATGQTASAGVFYIADATYGTFNVTSSTTSATSLPWRAFDGVTTGNTASAAVNTEAQSPPYLFATTAAAATTPVSGGCFSGAWLQLSLPVPFQPTSVKIRGRYFINPGQLQTFILIGSSDNITFFQLLPGERRSQRRLS